MQCPHKYSLSEGHKASFPFRQDKLHGRVSLSAESLCAQDDMIAYSYAGMYYRYIISFFFFANFKTYMYKCI